MKRIMNILGQLAKAATVIAVGSLVRISRGEGKGVFEQSIQNALAEVAQRYVRSVNP